MQATESTFVIWHSFESRLNVVDCYLTSLERTKRGEGEKDQGLEVEEVVDLY